MTDTLSELPVERLPVDQLVLDPANARRHNPRNIAAIMESLHQFGQRKPVVVTGDNVVYAGNGTVEAIRRMLDEPESGPEPGGWRQITEVWVTRFPGTQSQARAYAIADNRTSDLSDFDSRLLLKQIDDIDAELMRAVGYDAKETDDLRRAVAAALLKEEQAELLGSGRPPIYGDEEIVQEAFVHFRRAGFPYPVVPRYVAMQQINQLAATDPESLPRTHAGYHVPDPYNPHRFETQASGTRAPAESFTDDKQLLRGLRLLREDEMTISPTQVLAVFGYIGNTQMAAQFRPGYTLWMIRRFAPRGGTMLDTSTGFGGRLVGFFASELARYVGIDPSTKTHAGNSRMVDELCPAGKTVELINLPAEDVDPEPLDNSCDFAITSPPYFAKEKYAPGEDTQSYARYPEPDQWRHGFLRPMLMLQYTSLRPGSISVLNIAPTSARGGRPKSLPIDEWAIEDARDAGFEHVRTEQLPFQRVPGRGEHSETHEPVLIFRKPG